MAWYKIHGATSASWFGRFTACMKTTSVKMGPMRRASSPRGRTGATALTWIKGFLAALGLLGSALASSAETDATTATEEEGDGFFGLGWLDATQSYSSTRADALATQLDRFFGVERS